MKSFKYLFILFFIILINKSYSDEHEGINTVNSNNDNKRLTVFIIYCLLSKV